MAPAEPLSDSQDSSGTIVRQRSLCPTVCSGPDRCMKATKGSPDPAALRTRPSNPSAASDARCRVGAHARCSMFACSMFACSMLACSLVSTAGAGGRADPPRRGPVQAPCQRPSGGSSACTRRQHKDHTTAACRSPARPVAACRSHRGPSAAARRPAQEWAQYGAQRYTPTRQ